MSKLLPLFTVFILSGYSLNAKINESITKYSYGAIFSGIFVKSSGEILIGDSTVQLSVIVDGNTKTNNYTLIKKTNGLIYFSDGVQTYWFAFTSQKGKKKGFEYDTLISFNKDNTNIAMYYAKIE